METGATPRQATRFRTWLEPADETGPSAGSAAARRLGIEVEATCTRLWSPYTRRNDPVYRADALEVFLDPLGGGRVYRELEVAPTGAVFDGWIMNRTDFESVDAPRDLHVAFPREGEGSPAVHVRLDGRRPSSRDREALAQGLNVRVWTATWFLSLMSETGSSHPPAPDAWRLNVFRVQHAGPGSAPTLQAWSPTGLRDFHRPAAFRPLPLYRFAAKGSDPGC